MRLLLVFICCATFAGCQRKAKTAIIMTPIDSTVTSNPPPLPAPIIHFTPHVDTFYGMWIQDQEFNPYGKDSGYTSVYFSYYAPNKLIIDPIPDYQHFHICKNDSFEVNDSNAYVIYESFYNGDKHEYYHFSLRADALSCDFWQSAYGCADPPLYGTYTAQKVNRH